MLSRGHPSNPEDRKRAVDRRIGQNIRNIRESILMSVADLCSKLGVPDEDLLSWEAGAMRVPAELFIPCAQSLGVSAQALVVGVTDLSDDPEKGPFDHLLF